VSTGDQRRFALCADYVQIHLNDDDPAAGVDGDVGTAEADAARLATGDRFIAIGTARNAFGPAYLTRQKAAARQ